MQIWEDANEGVFVEGLSEYEAWSVEDCFVLLRRGESNRVTWETKFNIHSSWSHTVFQVNLETNVFSGSTIRWSKLNLCDLAGSEKLDTDDWLNEKHMEEHKFINLSLTSLGLVIHALAKNNPA